MNVPSRGRNRRPLPVDARPDDQAVSRGDAGRNAPRHAAEITLRGLLLGAVITVVFMTANLYMGLKTGVTFSTSIPAAMLSMGLLRLFGGAGILENNIVQTQASAAGTLCNVILVLPGLVLIGHWHGFPFWQTALVCAAGGTLGVLYTVPLRRVMVVQSGLPYPEGVAAAEVLRVGEAQRHKAEGKGQSAGLRQLGWGTGLAALFGFLSGGLRLLGDAVNLWIPAGGVVFRVAAGFSPALLAAGYLMGAAAGVAVLLGWCCAGALLCPGSPPWPLRSTGRPCLRWPTSCGRARYVFSVRG